MDHSTIERGGDHFRNLGMKELRLQYQLGIIATKPMFGGLRTTKAQVSAFIIRVLESIVSGLPSSEISIF